MLEGHRVEPGSGTLPEVHIVPEARDGQPSHDFDDSCWCEPRSELGTRGTELFFYHGEQL